MIPESYFLVPEDKSLINSLKRVIPRAFENGSVVGRHDIQQLYFWFQEHRSSIEGTKLIDFRYCRLSCAAQLVGVDMIYQMRI